MDFGALLQIAKKNRETSKDEGKYYKTKFTPPKKETKETKRLSANIQKFLQKREEEEKAKQLEKKRKLESLLALRDEKSKNKIRKMLKVTKSANKSVLDDAVDNNNTAVTLDGPEQPDADDYGYVSNEANAFYQRYIEKVKNVEEYKPFAPSRPQSSKDLKGTKERVKAAITRENEEKHGPRQRNKITNYTTTSDNNNGTRIKSSSSSSSSKNLYDPEAEKREEEERRKEEQRKRNKNRAPMPPPMDFHELLKLAEKKQHEPIEILPEVKKEPERLLTSKEKRELEERKRYEEARDRRHREAELKKDVSAPSQRMEPNGRIPKLNESNKTNTTLKQTKQNIAINNNINKNINNNKNKVLEKSVNPSKTKPTLSNNSSATNIRSSNANSALTVHNKQSSSTPQNTQNERNKNLINNNKSKSNGVREFPPRDTKILPTKTTQQTRQFPPSDIRQQRPEERKKPATAPKRRILDDDDEDEYDSEMDDFIDDGDAEEDYSSHIKAIFGYDKSRYRHLDEEDDAAMESNFAQVQREEYISKKIGIQEDLEDMRLEAEEKKRKMQTKKRKI